tara:strand:- start:300 stop:620 length:321 start_codon:yes stop_codon:yes gene_type:complete
VPTSYKNATHGNDIMSDCTSIFKDTSEKSTNYNETFNMFSEGLKSIGFFPRDYDAESLKKLFHASEALHDHLCKLDAGYYNEAREVKLIELANVYAKCSGVLRQLE